MGKKREKKEKMEKTEKKELMKAKKTLHPNSRKTNTITKRDHKSVKKQKAKLLNIKDQLMEKKLIWFKEHMHPNVYSCTEVKVAELILKYIRRNDEELEQIKMKCSTGKRGKHDNREHTIMTTKSEEQTEFDTCGIEIPDIVNPKQCEMLRNWNGDLKLISSFKFRRFGRKHLKTALQRIEREDKFNELRKELQIKE